MKLTEDLKHILNHTRPVWDEMRGKTIFLTGGTGFFGKWLLESFIYANETLALDARMIILSRHPEGFLEKHPFFQKPYFQFIEGDIRHFDYPNDPIDYIIHTASDVSGYLNFEYPLVMYDTIVDGTRRVLELARLNKIKAVLHTSSGAVYGRQPHDLTHIPEDFIGGQDVYEKGASYGEGKRVAEMLANIYYNKFGIVSKVARCFAFVGPYLPLDTNYAIGNFIRDIVSGNKIVIKGDGTPYRSYMYASDLTIWLWNILVFGKQCRPYNVGSDVDLTIEELARAVASFAKDGKGEVEILSPKGNTPPARYVPSIKRAKEELNLDFHIDLKEGIKRTIEFYS